MLLHVCMGVYIILCYIPRDSNKNKYIEIEEINIRFDVLFICFRYTHIRLNTHIYGQEEKTILNLSTEYLRICVGSIVIKGK